MPGAVTFAQEVLLGGGERGVAGRIGGGAGGHAGGGLEQAPAIQERWVFAVACPFGGGGGQPSADDPVGAGFGEPGVAQQRPGSQQHLMADLSAVRADGQQPLGHERVGHRLHLPFLVPCHAAGELRHGDPGGSVDPVAAGRRHVQEQDPCNLALTQGEPVVGSLRARRDSGFDPPGPLVVGHGQGTSAAVPPGLVQSVGEQRQDCGLGGAPGRRVAGWRVADGGDLAHQGVHEVGVDAGAGLAGGPGDHHPELAAGHRQQQVPVLDGVSELGVSRASGLEISSHAQDHQRCRHLFRALPGSGCRVQGGDECAPLLLLRAEREKLLELIDDQQQPRRPGIAAGDRTCGPALVLDSCLAGGESECGRVGLQRLQHGRRISPRQGGNLHRQFPQGGTPGGKHPAWPPGSLGRRRQSCLPQGRQEPGLQQRRLARPRHTRHDKHPAAVQAP